MQTPKYLSPTSPIRSVSTVVMGGRWRVSRRWLRFDGVKVREIGGRLYACMISVLLCVYVVAVCITAITYMFWRQR